MVVIDITGSGRLDNSAQVRARTALENLARTAFRAAGIPWRRLVVEDRGDGMIVLVPAFVSKVDLLDPLIPALVAGLRSYDGPRIRLRMAVHAGEVHRHPWGWTGADLNLACRLAVAAPLYRQLERSPDADLVVIVSDAIHRAVVRHGYRGVRPADYVPVRAVVKEIDEQAWLHVPDHLTVNVDVPRPSNTVSRLGS